MGGGGGVGGMVALVVGLCLGKGGGFVCWVGGELVGGLAPSRENMCLCCLEEAILFID